jgi:hypothetical protein
MQNRDLDAVRDGGMNMASFSFDDIELAFMFVSGGPAFENEAFLDTETGKVYHRSLMGGIDELEEAGVDCEEMVAVPHKNDLDLGQNLVFEFVASTLPDDYDRVRDIFRRRGAHGRFKDLLESKGLLETWHGFENESQADALRLWCGENEIQLSD